ncbi:MAG TPA: 3-phosphoshikimate 1-carboxyvinyltransferase [Acidobacteriota bacterium]|nr:3-phosphoshikimate 1-carboxyvinyltransferase [Acidobacteriota bacterium]
MSSTISLSKTQKLAGTVVLPGDKSISHRLGMLASLADGTTHITNFATSEDCRSTLNCMQALGVSVEGTDSETNSIAIEGRGLNGLQPPKDILDARNSGTTIRLLSGILAGQPFVSTITGDESLSQRPMRRIMTPLTAMGARIEATNDQFAPLTIHGGALHPIQYTLPMASAQVKSCVLLAGLYADGETSVIEPVPTRDHTERMLRAFGVNLTTDGKEIRIQGGQRLKAPPTSCTVPSDFSSAAFFLAAALMVEEADLTIRHVGMNPTRTGMLQLLQSLGAEIQIENERFEIGEPVADLRVTRHHRVVAAPLVLKGDIIPNVIDELPILAVLGACLGGVEIRDARELRVKESDRIRLVVENLRRLGAEVTEFEDGLSAPGNQPFRGAVIDTAGDHRIAMAFAIAALVADGNTHIQGAECVEVSFPKFYNVLHAIRQA